MHEWKAALVVLWDTPERTWHRPEYIANEILRRNLCNGRPRGRTPGKSVRTAMAERGQDHFIGDGRGNYRLKNREFSRPLYHRLKEAYPHFFREVPPTTDTTEHSVAANVPPLTERVETAPHGRAIPRRTKGRSTKPTVLFDITKLSRQLIPDEVSQFFEGKKVRIYVNAYERDRKAREQCVATQGYSCSVCEMNFEEDYGDLGIGFIHVHHLYPFSVSNVPRATNPDDDLRPVCPNCHAMLHKGAEGLLSIEELRECWRKAKKRKSRTVARNRRKRAKKRSDTK